MLLEMIAYENISYRYINDTRLASITGNGHSYSVNYDALGRAAVRVLDGSTTYFIYDGEKAILEYRGWSNPSAKNIYGKSIDEILMRTDYTQTPALTFYYQDDHEGSITHLTNASGNVIERYTYDAFGAPSIFLSTGQPINLSTVGNRFMFTGREYVASFGIYEYRNRAYHTGLGRFMSEDPKGFAAGDYNLFRYVGNDPLDRTDPMGLDSVIVTYPDYRVNGILQVGHSGLLMINNATGATRYAEYGRYDKPEKGIVQMYTPANRVTVANGEVNRRSLQNVLKELSHRSGKDGRVEGAYVSTNNEQQAKINSYVGQTVRRK